MNAVSSSGIRKKIREIREAEGLTRKDFFELTGIPIKTQTFYETERRDGVGSNILFKITKHPRFKKYTMWLMTDDISPSAGQIEPALTHSGFDQSKVTSRARTIAKMKSSRFEQKIG